MHLQGKINGRIVLESGYFTLVDMSPHDIFVNRFGYVAWLKLIELIIKHGHEIAWKQHDSIVLNLYAVFKLLRLDEFWRGWYICPWVLQYVMDQFDNFAWCSDSTRLEQGYNIRLCWTIIYFVTDNNSSLVLFFLQMYTVEFCIWWIRLVENEGDLLGIIFTLASNENNRILEWVNTWSPLDLGSLLFYQHRFCFPIVIWILKRFLVLVFLLIQTEHDLFLLYFRPRVHRDPNFL